MTADFFGQREKDYQPILEPFLTWLLRALITQVKDGLWPNKFHGMNDCAHMCNKQVDSFSS